MHVLWIDAWRASEWMHSAEILKGKKRDPSGSLLSAVKSRPAKPEA